MIRPQLTDDQIAELLERNGFDRNQETLGIAYAANEIRISIPARERRLPATVIVVPLEMVPEAAVPPAEDEHVARLLFESKLRD